MSTQIDIHKAQVEILRALLLAQHMRFSELHKKTDLSSEHFNFHLTKLINLKLIDKDQDKNYSLSLSGKEYANRIDIDNRTVERQPKTSALLCIERQRPDGTLEYLQQKRLKHPWYGYFVYLTGKARWGESIYETAARELDEEAGLTADIKLMAISHERDFVENTDQVVEDKMFYIFYCTNVQGEMIQHEEAENVWLSPDEFMGPDYKKIDGAERMYRYLDGFKKSRQITFEENEYHFPEDAF